MPKKHLVYLGLGSNLADRVAYLSEAVALLDLIPNSGVEKISSVYETEPVGFKDQPDFLNLVAGLATDLEPIALFQETKRIENTIGRISRARWNPREIDIDILLFDEIAFKHDHLIIPHPEMVNRRFVLLPLTEVAGGLLHPVEKVDVQTLLDRCHDDSRVMRTTLELSHQLS